MAEHDNVFGITKGMIRDIMNLSSVYAKHIKKDFDEHEISISNKSLSELLSKIIEVYSSKIFTEKLGYRVEKEKSDREPDLVFTRMNRPLEVKVTSTNSGWTGGEFSRRAPDYLLVSWGENFDEFFVALVHIEKSDWESRIEKRFYGPFFSIKRLYDIKQKTIFVGNLEREGERTKLLRERI